MVAKQSVKTKLRASVVESTDSVLEISTIIMEALAEKQDRRAKRIKLFSDRMAKRANAGKKQTKDQRERISTLLKSIEKLELSSAAIREAKLKLGEVKSERSSKSS